MNIKAAWNALWSRDAKADVSRALMPRWHDVPGTGTHVFPPGSRKVFAQSARDIGGNSVVAGCLGWLADNFFEAQLRFGKEVEANEWEPDLAFPALSLLKRPNPYWTARQTWKATMHAYKIDGNAYWVLGRGMGGMGKVRELYWVPNTQIKVVPGTDKPIKEYELDYLNGEKEYLKPDEVIHFRDGIDPENPIVGCSRIKKGIRTIAGSNAAETMVSALLANFAVTSYVLVPKEPIHEVDEAAMSAERDRLQRGTSGDNAGKVHYTTLPMEYVRLGMSPEEVMLDRTLDWLESTICALCGVNPMVIGFASGASMRSYDNQKVVEQQTWKNGLMPVCADLADTLTHQLVPLLTDDQAIEAWFDFSNVGALQEDRNEIASRIVTLRNGGTDPVISIDEARAMMDLEPLGGRFESLESELEAKQEEAEKIAGMMGQSQEQDPNQGQEPIADEGEDDDDE